MHGTSAYFTDPASITTGSFAAGSAVPPTKVQCSNGNVLWNAPVGASPSGYELNWSYGNINNPTTGTVNFGGGTTQGRPPNIGIFTDRTYRVTITAVYGSWSAESENSDTIRAQNFLFGTTWSC